jgi:hypothetical protein
MNELHPTNGGRKVYPEFRHRAGGHRVKHDRETHVLRWVVALLLLLPATVSAYSYRMMSDEALFDGADGVLTARVERSQRASDGDFETRYELSVLATLAGASLAPRQVLTLPGTFDAPRLNLAVDGVPRLRPGAQILLFYTRRDDGVLQPTQLSLGLFGRELLAGAGYYVRPLEAAREFGAQRTLRRFHAPREPAAFEHWLADRGRGVRRAPDYLRPAMAQVATQAKFTFSSFNFNPAGPARWFQFDTEQVLPWTAGADGQANTASNEYTAVQQALAAWAGDPTSRITTAYVGTAANPPTCNNPSQGSGSYSGHVCWNDPTARIAGSYNCNGGGTLAIGGSFASSPGQMFGGQLWYRRADAFVIIQDGAGCFMDGHGGADGAELLAHEIGHSLAFGHSCGDGSSPACNTSAMLDAATMRAFAHGDGRGAVLGDDDRAAAAVAYPMPGGDVTPPTVPANPAALANGNAITVSWSASSDAGSGVAGYQVERCLGAACNDFAQIVATAALVQMDMGLMPSTTYRYRVRAMDMAGNFSGYSAIASATTAALSVVPLANGVAVPGLDGAIDSQRFFTLQVPAGATDLLFTMSGGSGDADLYVRRGAAPTTAVFDCRPFLLGNNESCSVPAPLAAVYHVMIEADAAYAGVTLVGSFQVQAGGACIGDCLFRNGFE